MDPLGRGGILHGPPYSSPVHHHWHGRGVVPVAVRQQAGAGIYGLRPAMAAVRAAPNHHPPIEPAAEAIAVIRAHDVECLAVEEQIGPYLAVQLGDPLPGNAAVGRCVHEAVRIRRSGAEVGVRGDVGPIWQDGDGRAAHVLLRAGGHVVDDAARYVLKSHAITSA